MSTQTPFLDFRTKRLIFRAPEGKDDAPFLKPIFGSARNQYTSSMGICKPVGGSAWVEKTLEALEKCSLHVFICLPKSEAEPDLPGDPIGWMGLGASQHAHHRRSSFGMSIAEAYHGNGYGPEALEWLVEMGFNRMGLHSIECGSWNPAGIKVYKSVGFTEVGRERQAVFRDGKFEDMFIFDLLEDEWRARKAGKSS